MTKLERAFWDRLQAAHRGQIFRDVWREPFKFRVLADRWYRPDFASLSHDNEFVIWEVKGWMREDACLKLLAAAERYMGVDWVLVRRNEGKWLCRKVLPAGFAKDLFTPSWLE